MLHNKQLLGAISVFKYRPAEQVFGTIPVFKYLPTGHVLHLLAVPSRQVAQSLWQFPQVLPE
jgi:hypothetical protein